MVRTHLESWPVMAQRLCICHHFDFEHYKGESENCTLCKCSQFNGIARTSSRVYQRQSIIKIKRVDQLHDGDRIAVHLIDKYLVRAEFPTGALIAVVTGNDRMDVKPEDRFKPGRWRWIVTTDLGQLMPESGTKSVTVVVKSA